MENGNQQNRQRIKAKSGRDFGSREGENRRNGIGQ